MKELDRRLEWKLLGCLMFAVCVFFGCLVFRDASLSVATWTAQYVPSVAKLLLPSVGVEQFAGRYFGALAVCFPVFVAVLIWNEDIRFRVTFLAEARRGNGLISNLAALYLLGVPIAAATLFVIYEAPFDLPHAPRLAGQYALHWMISSGLGMMILGSVLSVVASMFAAILVGLAWLPFSALFHSFFRENTR